MSQIVEPRFQVADLVPRMTTELGYRPAVAEQVAAKLVNAAPDIKRIFWEWWATGRIDNSVRIEGYTIERLMTEKSLPPMQAFSTLDWLRRDPQQALRAFGRRERKPSFRSVSSS